MQIHGSESKLVSRLFIFEFFQGAAIAIYFTAAISIFLGHLPASELPKVFILSAVVLWLFGFLYSKLEHVLLTRQLVIGVLLFNGFVIIFFRLFMNWQDEKWFLYCFLAAFNILYLLNSLEFWGLVALIFDVRQSKRLFSIVSAGDVPAKMVGYLMALAFASMIGIENLLWIAVACVVAAGLLFIPLSQSEEMKNLAPTKHHHYATQSIQNIQAAIKGNKLIGNAAMVSFFSFSFYIIVNFILYGYIKDHFRTDQSLAIFFSVFFAVSRSITLVIKLVFTSRLVNRIGLRKALLLSPVILLILSAITLGVQAPHVAFYSFGVMAISADILRSSIQSPVLLATLQPLPAIQRLRGHTLIKGLMDPFAFFASGILLLVILSSTVELNFVLLSAILVTIAISWIISCLFVDKNYIKMLTAAIRRYSLDGRDITITDNDSLNFLLKRMQGGDEKESISVLQLISSQPVNHEKFYTSALHHNSPNVRKLALQLIVEQNYQTLVPDLKEIMHHQASPTELHLYVHAIGILDKTEDISMFLENPDMDVSNAAIIALLSQADESKKENAAAHLLKLFESTETSHQIHALRIVSELKAQQFSDSVYKVLQRHDATCRHHALQAAGKLASDKLIDHLLSEFLYSDYDRDILAALELAGDAATRRIYITLQTGKCSRDKRQKLYSLLGKTGSNASISLLQENLERSPQDLSYLLSILFHVKYRCVDNADSCKKLIRDVLEMASVIVYKSHFLKDQPHKYALIMRALELELAVLKDSCIYLFSFLYDAEKVGRAKSGFDLNTKESLANSFELIEGVIPREYSILFTAIFEYPELPDKYLQIKKFYTQPPISIDSLVKDILQDDRFNDWTKSCTLYTFKNDHDLWSDDIIQKNIRSDNPILKEIAEIIYQEKKLLHQDQ